MPALNPARLPLGEQLTLLRTVLETNQTLVKVLSLATTLNLPNWYLAGGAVSQTIWNHVSSLPPTTGIADYDLVYHDASDLSYAAEDAVIRRGKQIFADISGEVEIRNQARVHLWYEAKFGAPCPRHESTEAGIDTWISTSAMIGVRVEGDGKWRVYAPRGLSEYFAMVVRPNPTIGVRDAYEAKARRWLAIWKDLKVMPWTGSEVPLRFDAVEEDQQKGDSTH
ncbi:hypothetical protein CORC01_10530 [Colletotrichum orchidophilum]|uniref:Uncharacterized protein n=1 Tax=Colletotrichum orchidophilum TaxID=1209926 RepID=A0A1G4AYT3_9PEZI|nr:uncharacterized protein CORC01_10530 [Colletotrichum orchidophilum]OHE94192.1 hypothetical protein CORC01_10530 [Colletotrichum orchidophilum]